MATYIGRKGPNVSQYVANLNAIPSPNDVSAKNEDDLNLDDDLARFTNAEFLDFDAGDFFDPSHLPDYDPSQEESPRKANAVANAKFDVKGMDFSNGKAHLLLFNNSQYVLMAYYGPLWWNLSLVINKARFADNAPLLDAFQFTGIPSYISTDQPPGIPNSLPNTFIPDNNLPAPSYASPTFPSITSPIDFNAAPYTGQKHQLLTSPAPSFAALADPNSQEPETPASRHAAEEDKRRRNTAASARFRVKKKQREQALENTAKDLENKVGGLEQRIGQLEAENDFLRGLVVAKDGGDKSELRARWEKFGKGEGETKGSEGKKGVGTEGEEF